MGVVVQGLPPGVEYRQTSAFDAQQCRVQGRLLYSLRRTFKEQVVTESLVEVEQWIEKLRNSKHCMKIPDREKSAFEFFNPQLLLYILALGTVTVSTAVIADFDRTAGVAAQAV